MRPRWVRAGRPRAVAAGTAAAGMVLAGLLAAATPGAAAAASPPGAVSGNLIADGNGEAGYCTRDWNAATTIPGWTVTAGSPGVMCYSAARFRHPAGTIGQGFFSAGPYGDSAMTQLVRLGPRARGDGPVTFRLSSWLGGWRGEPGYVTVSLAFLDERGGLVGRTAGLPVVSRTDRGGRTGFLSRGITGTVPPRASAARVSVAFRRSANPPGGEPYPRGPGGGMLDNLALTLSVPARPGRLQPPRSAVPHFDHVFMIMMENTNGSAVLGRGSGMPFFHQLMARGTTLANYHAVYHPSDENYLAVAGGASYARGAIYWPDIKDPGRNLADELQAQGVTWKAYEQGMGFACNAIAKTEFKYDKYYYPDDAPFINYTDVSGNQARCRAHLVDARQLVPDLKKAVTTPGFAWIAADDYYDGESPGNGNLQSREVQDGWLRRTVTPILDSPAWRTQNSLLIITWDEASQTVKIAQAANGVAAVLVGSPGTVRAGYVSRVRYDHYSTARTIEEALGLGPFTANDEYAVPVNDAFTRRRS